MVNSARANVLERGAEVGEQKLALRILGLVFVVLLVISCGIFANPAQAVPTTTIVVAPSTSPTPTPIPILVPTVTPLAPSLVVNAAVSCLSGPGDSYERVVDFLAGEKAEIIGKSNGFWVVKTAAGEECWVSDQGVTTIGEVAAVPSVEPPPTPKPAAPAPPINLQTIGAVCSIDKSTKPTSFINQFHLAWQDMSNNEEGFRIYRDGNRVAELPADRTDYVDELISHNNHTHYYYVVAYNAIGESKSEAIALTCEGAGSGGSGGGGGGGGLGP